MDSLSSASLYIPLTNTSLVCTVVYIFVMTESHAGMLLDILRIHGVRLQNAKKNVGKVRNDRTIFASPF
jgi:hypothetical protein